METYTKIDVDTLKVTTTETIDGIEYKNEKPENRADIEKQIKDAQIGLAELESRKQEFVDRLATLNKKLEVFK